MEYEEPSRRLASAVGWSVSLVLHALLFLTFTGITWFAGSGKGSEGQDVGYVGEENRESIEAGDAPIERIEAPAAQFSAVQLTAPVAIQPIESIGTGSGPAKVESVIGIAGGPAGGAVAMKGDWSQFYAAGGGGGGGGGGGASFFGLEARGRDFVYVVDYSGSMSGQKLRAAKSELIRSISALRRNMRFYVIFYNHQFQAMPSSGLVKATQQNKSTYFAWIEQVRGGGGTVPSPATRAGLALKPDAVWLLSDGLFPMQQATDITAANPGARVQIHTIAFFDNAGEAVLQYIAEHNRGKYRFVPPAAIGVP